jgi:HEAT repeat protein
MKQLGTFVCLTALSLVCPAIASAQELAYEDVVRNLRNPDPEVRVSAVRLLREAKYPEAVVPLAALINDPIDEIQLEAMSAELSFFVTKAMPTKRKIAFVLERRASNHASRAFDMGPFVPIANRPPAELVKGLLNAVDDENGDVRMEAIYTLGAIAGGSLSGEHEQQLIVALDHDDPAIRAAAARVIARLQIKNAGDSLIKAMNDSNDRVRYASMRALGESGEARAVEALTQQFNYYGKGEGAWSALEALARIAHPSSVELFTSRLADRDPNIRRAAAEGLGRTGYVSAVDALQIGATADESETVRAAMAFALHKLGQHYLGRMLDFLGSDKAGSQVQGYLLELGPSIVAALLPRLQEPDEAARRRLTEVIGVIGDSTALPALTRLTQDRDREVVDAAAHAIERIKSRAAQTNSM